MKKIASFLFGFALLPSLALAQNTAIRDPVSLNTAAVNASRQLEVNASVSASITGFPTSQTTGTPITATTSGVTGTLPVGNVVVVTNKGTTNTAFCKLGASATVNDQPISPNNGWFAFTVGANTQLTCITASSTTVLNLVGGSGLPTGTGGGSAGGGGGGAVTVADGADVTQGTIGDTQATGTVVGFLKSLFTIFNTNAPATAAKQDTGNTSLGTIATNTTGVATAANQTTGNSSLSTIATNTTGASTAANQTSVIGTKAAGTAATNSLLTGCVYNTSLPTLTNGQQAAAQCDSSGRPLVAISGAGDATAANQTAIIGTKAAGTAATNSALTGCVYTSAGVTPSNGQQVATQCDANGNINVNVKTAAGVAQAASISGLTLSPTACQNLTANPTAYTTAQVNIPTCDVYGGQVVQPYALSAGLVKGTTSAMTGTTSTSLIAAPGAGLKNYITSLSCVNSHATVGTFVTVQDGSGGTAIWTVAAAALFGGTVVTFPSPLQQPTANTALYVANVTTGANVICSASGFKAP